MRLLFLQVAHIFTYVDANWHLIVLQSRMFLSNHHCVILPDFLLVHLLLFWLNCLDMRFLKEQIWIFVLYYLGFDGLLLGHNFTSDGLFLFWIVFRFGQNNITITSGFRLCHGILLIWSFFSIDLNKITRGYSCCHCRGIYILRRQQLASSLAGLLRRVFGAFVFFIAAFALALVVKLFNDNLQVF